MFGKCRGDGRFQELGWGENGEKWVPLANRKWEIDYLRKGLKL